MEEFSLAHVNHFTLRKQHLTSDSCIDDVVQISRNISGIWDVENSTIKLYLFNKPGERILKPVMAKAIKMGRFIHGGEVRTQSVDTMTPLTQRNAGGFMSPLRIS